VHCIVPAVGLIVSGKTKLIGRKGRYLFPVKAVRALFKGKMLVSIRKTLPRRYVKIRYYGIYSSRFFRTLSSGIVKLKVPVKQESSIERIKRLTGVDICRCPVCKIGVMQIIEEIPRIRSPGYLQAVSLKSL